MSSVQIVADKIINVYNLPVDYAVDSHCFYECVDFVGFDIIKFAVDVSNLVKLDNLVLCAEKYHFALFIQGVFMVIYIDNDSIYDICEVIVRRCNDVNEFSRMMLEII